MRRRLLLRDRWPAGKAVHCWPGLDAPRDLQQAVRQRSHPCGQAGSPLLLDKVLCLQCPANVVNTRPMQEASRISLVVRGMHMVDKESRRQRLTAADVGSTISSAAAVRRTGKPIRAPLQHIQKQFVSCLSRLATCVVSCRGSAAPKSTLVHRDCSVFILDWAEYGLS